MNQQPLDRSEFEAAPSVRKNLGLEMEPALVESFAGRMVVEIRRQQVMNSGGIPQTLIPAGQSRVQRYNRSYSTTGLAITSMVLAIPLAAVALAYSGTLMGMVIWAGIIGINFAVTLGNFRFNDPSSHRHPSNG